MGFPLLWRYLLKRFLFVFLFSTAAFIVILVTMRLSDIAHFASLGADFPTLLLFIAYQIPFILPIAIPVSALISSLILSSSLSSSREIIALWASGASLRNIFTPIWIAALFLSLANFALVSEVSTHCHFSTQLLKTKMRSVNPLLILHNKHLMKTQGGFFDSLGPSKMGLNAHDAVIAFAGKSGKPMQLILAKKLESKKNQFYMEDLTLLARNGNLKLLTENIQETKTGKSDFNQLIEKKISKVNLDHLPLSSLLQRVKDTRDSAAFTEIIRRLSASIAVFSFTLLGTCFGINTARIPSKKGAFIVIALAAGFLMCYFLGKGLEEKREAATVLYLIFHPIVWLFSIFRLQAINKGLVA